MTRILCTGMSGFMAGRFFQYLAREQPEVKVVGFDRAYGQDVRNGADVEEAVKGVDVVFHFAALTHIDSSIAEPEPFVDTNVNGTMNLLQACTKHQVKLVQISSSEIYGSLTQQEYEDGITQDEGFRLNPQSPYAATKVAQDVLCTAWWHTYGTDVRVLRPFNQWGPGQDIRKMIPKFFQQVMSGQPITVYGEGQSTRDWVWVDDFVEAVWRSVELPAGTVVNVATGVSYSVLEVVERIQQLVGKRSQVVLVHHTDERWGYVKHLRGDGKKITQLLRWKPTMTLDDGLERLYEWIQTNGAVCYRGGEGSIRSKPTPQTRQRVDTYRHECDLTLKERDPAPTAPPHDSLG